MPKKIKNAIAAPDRLKPFSEKDSSIIRVVIETPKGCQNKYLRSRLADVPIEPCASEWNGVSL